MSDKPIPTLGIVIVALGILVLSLLLGTDFKDALVLTAIMLGFGIYDVLYCIWKKP